jgi:hypothetical protein
LIPTESQYQQKNINYISFVNVTAMNDRALEKIQKEMNLKTGELDLNYCDLYEIPREISEMTWLTNLKLQRNSICDIQRLAQIKKLKAFKYGRKK